MTREAEARDALVAKSAPWDRQTPSWWEALDAYRDAILAAERERTAALVAAGVFWMSHGGHAHWCSDPCDCGTTALRAALRAYEAGGSE